MLKNPLHQQNCVAGSTLKLIIIIYLSRIPQRLSKLSDSSSWSWFLLFSSYRSMFDGRRYWFCLKMEITRSSRAKGSKQSHENRLRRKSLHVLQSIRLQGSNTCCSFASRLLWTTSECKFVSIPYWRPFLVQKTAAKKYGPFRNWIGSDG